MKNARVVIKDDFDITVSADMLKVLVIQNPNVFELSKNLSGKNAVRIIGEKYIGTILEKDEKKMQISTDKMPIPFCSLEYFPAYRGFNKASEWNAYNKGDEVHFLIVDNPLNPNFKMAKLLPTSIFVAESMGMNMTPNLKGKLQNPVEGIFKASISKKILK